MSGQVNRCVGGSKSLSISYIVSAYDRPHLLPICLLSLLTQTHRRSEIIVTDNSEDPAMNTLHEEHCRRYGAKYLHTAALTCYHSAEMGAEIAVGKYLCFPSDDSYYMPLFAEKMLDAAYPSNLDLVYCEMVHNETPLPQGGTGYRMRGVEPRTGWIDKTGYIVKRDSFIEFPGKRETPGPSASDGYLIDRLVKTGARHMKIDDVLVVHN